MNSAILIGLGIIIGLILGYIVDQCDVLVPKQTYSFTLLLVGINEITEEIENELFLAGFDDCLLGQRDGQVYLYCSRRNTGYYTAIGHTMLALKLAGYETQLLSE